MPKGRQKIQPAIVGNAGEHYVMGELLRRGVVAALAPRNNQSFDILATDGARTVHLRVKTKRDAKIWRWNAKSGDSRAPVLEPILQNDFTVLVDLKGNDQPPRYYVLETRWLETYLRDSHKEWLEGKASRSKDNKMRTVNESSPVLEQFRNNWKCLGLATSEPITTNH